jgi:hypothetical protein
VDQGERRVRVERGQGLGEAPSDCELGRRHRRLQRQGVLQIQGASSAGGSARAMISSAAVTRLVGWWVIGRTVSAGTEVRIGVEPPSFSAHGG